jgi:hypothetical protein
MKTISRVHRFLWDQSFYPILLSSLFGLVLFIGRAFLTSDYPMDPDLELPLKRLFFSLLAVTQAALPGVFSQLVPVGGSFFPNAPYLLTDFNHLQYRPPIPLWFDILLLATFAWTGLFLAVASLRAMQSLVKEYVGGLGSWAFVVIAASLSSLGVYLGRFLRLNSWDLLLQPFNILEAVLRRLVDPLSHLGFIGFTGCSPSSCWSAT